MKYLKAVSKRFPDTMAYYGNGDVPTLAEKDIVVSEMNDREFISYLETRYENLKIRTKTMLSKLKDYLGEDELSAINDLEKYLDKTWERIPFL